jgi:protein TonB
MNFSALLFCQDEKIARLTTQILNELEFTVETSSEPFAAVKKLMGQHFDAVVVDCDNEQNASLLFKGARNSQLNQSSLAVAVVEGQTGVANAFRIGANLVLTKPINVEQAKGTLRVARGLLKKGGESAKAPAPSASTGVPAAAAPVPAPPPASMLAPPSVAPAPKASPVATTPLPAAQAEAISRTIPPSPAKAVVAPVMSKQSTDNVLDLEPETADSTEDVLLDLGEKKPASKPELKLPAKPSSLLEAEQVVANAAPPRPAAPPVVTSGGGAAAPAPARVPEVEKIGDSGRKPQFAAAAPARPASTEAPGLFSQRSSAPTFGGLDMAEPEAPGGATKYAIIAVAVIALAAAGYYGYAKFHQQSSEPAPTQQVVPSSAMPEAPSAIVTPEPAPKPKAAVAEKPSADVNSTTHKPESPKIESSKAEEAEPEVVVKNFEEPRMVKSNPSSAAKKKLIETEVEAPSAIGATTDDQSALSNIVSSAPVRVPSAAPAPEMLKVSQGVTQGMLLKRVQPVYPHAAMQMRVAGSVQIQATIDKGGNISSVKVLSGDPILARAAVDAVKQWKYKPYMLDGDAVEIQTQVTVNFKLP